MSADERALLLEVARWVMRLERDAAVSMNIAQSEGLTLHRLRKLIAAVAEAQPRPSP